MANVNIFEMGTLDGKKPVRLVPWNAKQAAAPGAGSAPFKGGTKFVTVQTDTLIYANISKGGDPAVSGGDYRINANDSADFEVQAGHVLTWTT